MNRLKQRSVIETNSECVVSIIASKLSSVSGVTGRTHPFTSISFHWRCWSRNCRCRSSGSQEGNISDRLLCQKCVVFDDCIWWSDQQSGCCWSAFPVKTYNLWSLNYCTAKRTHNGLFFVHDCMSPWKAWPLTSTWEVTCHIDCLNTCGHICRGRLKKQTVVFLLPSLVIANLRFQKFFSIEYYNAMINLANDTIKHPQVCIVIEGPVTWGNFYKQPKGKHAVLYTST